MRRIVSIVVSLLSVGMGGFYMSLPATEIEVRLWGAVSIVAGLCVVITIMLVRSNVILRSAMGIGFGIVILGQVLPILAWSSSYAITDGTDGLIGSIDRLWALPHIVIVVGCVWNIILLSRNR